MFDLTGQVVVITGASSGLGRQMAHGFAEHGADLVIMARRFEKLEELAKELKEKYSTKVFCVKCDVTDSDMIDAAAAKVETEMGKVDVLVNCAGSSSPAGVLEATNESWNFTVATDLSSVFYVTRAFGNIMKKNNYGRIINIASMFGLIGNMAMPTFAYHTTKGGVVNFTRAVAAELAQYNITVNAICPGFFKTELTTQRLNRPEIVEHMKKTTPLGRYGEPGELNSAAIFFAAKESSYVTGTILPVDGGTTCI